MKKLTTLELEQTLQQFITTTVSRYRGQCYAWDVVNEALTDDGHLRRSLWSRIEAFIPKCFRWAHQADPDAQLIYLDYRLHKPGRQRAIHQLASELRADGIPIHGIGLQLYHEASRALAVSKLILPNLNPIPPQPRSGRPLLRSLRPPLPARPTPTRSRQIQAPSPGLQSAAANGA
ncbi:MAG: hypothetical protein HC838_08880 [Spirulinaceae cyanobacterium RM2_2_10]|nr:hypothetical protein [Spirulinaceae cyanobacterium RM2_2_10]